MPKYTFEAAQFCDAIRELASKPENLQNLESYLEWSLDKWMEKICQFSCLHSCRDVRFCADGNIKKRIMSHKPVSDLLAGFSLCPYVSIFPA